MARPEGMGYDRYLLDGERVVVALHRHWAMVAKPVAASVVGLVFATWVEVITPAGAKIISTAVWWLWLALVAWTVWQLVGWRREWFLATDKRLILTQGLIAKNVAMMPLTKVTDLSYVRSIPGRVVGYGQFVLESAGQDQALRQIDWVPDPNHTYRVICAEIFGYVDNQSDDEDDTGRPDREDRSGSGSGSGSGDGDGDGAGPPRVPSPLGRSRNSGGVPSAVDERWSFSQAIPLHRRGQSSAIPSGEVIYSSDEARLRRRMADTGPIPLPPQSDD